MLRARLEALSRQRLMSLPVFFDSRQRKSMSEPLAPPSQARNVAVIILLSGFGVDLGKRRIETK